MPSVHWCAEVLRCHRRLSRACSETRPMQYQLNLPVSAEDMPIASLCAQPLSHPDCAVGSAVCGGRTLAGAGAGVGNALCVNGDSILATSWWRRWRGVGSSWDVVNNECRGAERRYLVLAGCWRRERSAGNRLGVLRLCERLGVWRSALLDAAQRRLEGAAEGAVNEEVARRGLWRKGLLSTSLLHAPIDYFRVRLPSCNCLPSGVLGRRFFI